MFLVEGGSIYIHRGDSASFDIVFGEPNLEKGNSNTAVIDARDLGYESVPEDGTRLRFTVKVDVNRPKCIIQKDYVINNGFVCIAFESKDTSMLPFGEYQWDIRLSFTNADTINWNTPFNSYPFYITEVVGNDGC